MIIKQGKYYSKDSIGDPDLADSQYLKEVKSSLSNKRTGEGMFRGGRTGEVSNLNSIHAKMARSQDDLAMLLSNQSHPGIETLFGMLEEKKSN